MNIVKAFSIKKCITRGLLKSPISPYRFIPAPEIIIDEDQFPNAAINDQSITILNWNIAKNNNHDNWASDFIQILDEHRPDLIILQEVRLDTDKQYILVLEEMGWNFVPNFIDNHHGAYAGILTASKVKYLTRKSLITQHYEPLTKTPKVSLITEYPFKHSNQNLLVINTHIINFVELQKFQSQLEQVERAIAKHDGPIIMAGDFNTWSQGRAKLLNAMARRLNLINVSFLPNSRHKIKRFLYSPPLDHIFYRGLDEKQGSAKVLDQVYSSDHKPMIVEFLNKT